MASVYGNLVDAMEKAAAEPALFIDGHILPFGEEEILDKDAVYDSLMTANPQVDAIVEMQLAAVIPAIVTVIKKHAADYIQEDGKYNL